MNLSDFSQPDRMLLQFLMAHIVAITQQPNVDKARYLTDLLAAIAPMSTKNARELRGLLHEAGVLPPNPSE